MATSTMTGNYKRSFTVNAELFEIEEIDIYELMVGLILSSFTQEPIPPSVDQIARLGKMNAKQASLALQGLLERGILPGKVFRRILGDFGDHRLSWAAKGLLSYLKSNPEVDLFELVEKSKDDESAVRVELESLKQYGYLDELMEAQGINES